MPNELVLTIVNFLKQTSYLKYEESIREAIFITIPPIDDIQMGTCQFQTLTQILDKEYPNWRELPQAKY